MHSRVVTRQFSKKTPQLAHPRNGAVLEPNKSNALHRRAADAPQVAPYLYSRKAHFLQFLHNPSGGDFGFTESILQLPRHWTAAHATRNVVAITQLSMSRWRIIRSAENLHVARPRAIGHNVSVEFLRVRAIG